MFVKFKRELSKDSKLIDGQHDRKKKLLTDKNILTDKFTKLIDSLNI